MVSAKPTTWLLAWNPKFYTEEEMAEDFAPLRLRKTATFNWNCGRTKAIAKGDRAFMIRLGAEPRGIVGSGRFTGTCYEEEHWSAIGTTNYIDVKWDFFSLLPIIVMDDLLRPPFRGFKWSTQSSGIRIPPDLAVALEKRWRASLRKVDGLVKTPGVSDARISEGAVRRSVADRYERNPKARIACIAHHGTACVACGFDFHDVYGEAGAGLVVVHHLHPLSEERGKHLTNPVTDLRPVCANCHLLIHRQNPPLRIEEVMELIG